MQWTPRVYAPQSHEEHKVYFFNIDNQSFVSFVTLLLCGA
jgi:hypothetical protein